MPMMVASRPSVGGVEIGLAFAALASVCGAVVVLFI
jgi:hypothetical protein